MRTGRYAYSETDLSGGGGQGALALTRIMPEAVGNHANPFGNFSHNWDIFLIETPVARARRRHGPGQRPLWRPLVDLRDPRRIRIERLCVQVGRAAMPR